MLIVDAMNVIGSRPDGWWRDRDAAVRRLADRLRRYAEASGAPVMAVMDGATVQGLEEGSHGPLEVRYATRRGPGGADDRIVAVLRERDGPATVVTADRELASRAQALGAGLLRPGELLARLDRLDGEPAERAQP